MLAVMSLPPTGAGWRIAKLRDFEAGLVNRKASICARRVEPFS
jgi:hypothetical protein